MARRMEERTGWDGRGARGKDWTAAWWKSWDSGEKGDGGRMGNWGFGIWGSSVGRCSEDLAFRERKGIEGGRGGLRQWRGVGLGMGIRGCTWAFVG